MRPERSLMFWRQLAAMRAEPFAAVPDAALLDRYTANRDDAAFEELARRHGGMVWAVCRQLLPDPADAEDAFQAVFLAFVKSSGRVRNGNVGAWLHGTAVRGAMKLRRGAVRARQRDRATAKPEATAPPADWNELLTAVHEEVGRLPEALRTAFVVCDLEGVPQPDAATRLGWKAGTLTGRLSKARKRLLAALTKRGLAPAATLGLLGLSAATTSADVPLKLLVTVLNFPSAAPGTIPAALAALSLEIVPMTLSKVKLLALATMLTCGLAAGTGTVLVPMADAQGPPAASKPAGAPTVADPLAIAPPPTLTADPKPTAVAEVEYKYIPGEYGEAGTVLNARPFRETVKLITEQSRSGWEFAGTFNSKDNVKEFERVANGLLLPNMPQDATIDCTFLVFKKQRTPAKQAPVTITDSKSGTTLTADALLMGAFFEPPIANPALCTTAFTVTETPEFGVTVTYTYKPGEVVAPQHLRYAGKNATAPSTTANPPKQAITRIPPQTQDRLEAQPVPSSSAAPQVKPLELVPATPTLFNPAVNKVVIAPADFKVTMVGSNGAQETSIYRQGDAVPPHHVSFMPKPGDKSTRTPTPGPVVVLSDTMPPPSFSKPVVPPVAVSEPVVIELKVLSPQIVVMLCQEVLPKSVKVFALSETGKIIVINATPNDVAVLKKLLAGIDVPGKNQPQNDLSRPSVFAIPERSTFPPPNETGDRAVPSDSPPLPGPRIEAQPLPAPSPMPAKKPKTKPPADPHMSPERIHGGIM